MDTSLATESGVKNGKLDVTGITIDISQLLGQKIVDQYITQLSPEDLQKVMDYISSDLFEPTSMYNYELHKHIDSIKVKQRAKDRWGGWSDEEIPIGWLIKNHFNERIKEELKKKVEEIIASADYQAKIEEIANELVDYSVNGYKEDMKARIRERLVGNVFPSYNGQNLLTIIDDQIAAKTGCR